MRLLVERCLLYALSSRLRSHVVETLVLGLSIANIVLNVHIDLLLRRLIVPIIYIQEILKGLHLFGIIQDLTLQVLSTGILLPRFLGRNSCSD